MFKNYLRVALRNLWKYKSFSAINIAGLALGVAACLLILLWVQSELAVDAWHANGARLYKVYEREFYDGKIDGNYDTPGPLADELERVLPEVEYAAALKEDNDLSTLQAGEKQIKAEGTPAGEHLFHMFSYHLLKGEAGSVLTSPDNIVLSEKLATELYGSAEAAMGKMLRYENKKPLQVSGVFADIPANASRRFDYVTSWHGYQQQSPWAKDWQNSGPLTFVQLRPGVAAATVNNKIRHIWNNYTRMDGPGYKVELALQPYTEIYLHNRFKNGQVAGGRVEYVHLFSLVALFILLIACINFMNLTTARSMKRAKEIGVRKVVGAVRSALIKQFMGETLLLTLLSVLLALVLVQVSLPLFNSLTGKQITLPLTSTLFWLKLAGLTLVTGLLAGSYPALLLSSFSPLKVLKGSIKQGVSALLLRKVLVVFQFVLSVVLIIGTLVIAQQVHFIQTRNLGYDKDNLILIPQEGELNSKFALVKNSAEKMPGIQSVALISDIPTYLDQNTNSVEWAGKNANQKISFTIPRVGYDFVKTMQLHLLEGRDFSPGYPTDSTAFIINETAAAKMGFSKKALGQQLTIWGFLKGPVIGVVKDFHFRSLHQQMLPLIIRLAPGMSDGNLLVHAYPGQTQQALQHMQALCRQVNPAFPFSYRFLNDTYRNMYAGEQTVGRLSNLFAGLAIFIACLGLLGLAIFTAEQRVKEIGVRKVLGASVASLFGLLSREFLALIIIALFIACPIAWFAMHSWLQEYAYHTRISWWVFAAAGSSALAVSLLMISFQTLRAAMANPVKSLRAE